MGGNVGRHRKGTALLVVLGILLLLALLATTFATLQGVERTITRNYMDGLRAKAAAEAGVDRAVWEIHDAVLNEPDPSRRAARLKALTFYGNDVNENGVKDPGEEQDGKWLDAPLEWAKNPSVAHEDEPSQNPTDSKVLPKIIKIQDPNEVVKDVGFSGLYSTGTYARNGDLYHLRIQDLSGRLYVNDGVYLYGGNNSSVSINLRRLLDNLGKLPGVNIPNLGQKIIQNRPPGGYRNKFELSKVLGDDLAKVERFITTHAWVDKNVCNPVPLSAQAAALPDAYPVNYYRGGIYRRGRGVNAKLEYRFSFEPLMWADSNNIPGTFPSSDNFNAVYAMDELHPSYIEIVWRAPVNVNVAAREVLTVLIADLSGFFVSERRRFAPYSWSRPNHYMTVTDVISWGLVTWTWSEPIWTPQKYYMKDYNIYSYDTQQGMDDGDEYGFLYRTNRYAGPWATATGAISAETIADHIIACREKGSFGGVNYANEPFGGMFKNWAQFYRFVDNLVEKGVIFDSRPIFWDYVATSDWAQSPPAKVPSLAQQKHAAYAAGDVLKANFNPNLHLNEMNPDANLYLRVDKTDLIVNSTEFSFMPSGYFEIDSVGRILKPREAGPIGTGIPDIDAFASAGNIIVAEKKISVVVKLFDQYRETSQRHFYNGTLFPKSSGWETSSNKALQIGPEPDQGPIGPLINPDGTVGPIDNFNGYISQTSRHVDDWGGYPNDNPIITGWGYEYDGYIQLATYGGLGIDKPKGTFQQTPWGSPHFNTAVLNGLEGFHCHFDWDFKAHYHGSVLAHGNQGFRDEVGSVTRQADTYLDQVYLPYWTPRPKIERVSCFFDDPNEQLGPYCPTYNLRYRNARSFRLPIQAGGGGTEVSPSLPSLAPFAPSDLRIDGAYSERHSCPAYWVDEGPSWNYKGGLLCAWIKPSFFPEHTGKIRKIFGFSRFHGKATIHRNPQYFDLLFYPAHDAPPYTASGTENLTPSFVNSSLVYGTGDFYSMEKVVYLYRPPNNAYKDLSVWPYRPASLAAIWNTNCYDGGGMDFNDLPPFFEYENYAVTPTLNHNLHPDGLDTGSTPGNAPTTQPNYLEHHRWTHVMWKFVIKTLPGSGWTPVYNSEHKSEIYINGQILAGSVPPVADGTPIYCGSYFLSPGRETGWHVHGSIDPLGSGKQLANVLRLGEVSEHGMSGTDPFLKYAFPRNYSGDWTVDEFYCFRSTNTALNGFNERLAHMNTAVSGARKFWELGRYYRPSGSLTTGGYATDALFESAKLRINAQKLRYLPNPSTIGTPPGSTGSETSVTVTLPPSKVRIVGVSWTWYAEDYRRSDMKPVMYDRKDFFMNAKQYKKWTGKPLVQDKASCRVWLCVYDQSGTLKKKVPNNSEGFFDDAYSQVFDSSTNQNYVELEDTDRLTYRVGFIIEELKNDSILLATPVFDDITIFYTTGGPEFLSYILVNTTY